jgi:hypothetical protein
VSVDPGNIAVKGSDQLVYVPNEVTVATTAPSTGELWMDMAAADPLSTLEERIAVLESLVARLTGGVS